MFSRFATNSPSFFLLLTMFTFFFLFAWPSYKLYYQYLCALRIVALLITATIVLSCLLPRHIFSYSSVSDLCLLFIFAVSTVQPLFAIFTTLLLALLLCTHATHILHRAHFFWQPPICMPWSFSIFTTISRELVAKLTFAFYKTEVTINKLFCVIVIINELLVVKIVKVTIGWLSYLM